MIRGALLFTALFATIYATITMVIGMDTDFLVSTYVAIGALALLLLTDWPARERERRARMAAYRAQVWQRRDREAGLR